VQVFLSMANSLWLELRENVQTPFRLAVPALTV
jgi:hypothetical protein